jgi:hypothetical protein
VSIPRKNDETIKRIVPQSSRPTSALITGNPSVYAQIPALLPSSGPKYKVASKAGAPNTLNKIASSTQLPSSNRLPDSSITTQSSPYVGLPPPPKDFGKSTSSSNNQYGPMPGTKLTKSISTPANLATPATLSKGKSATSPTSSAEPVVQPTDAKKDSGDNDELFDYLLQRYSLNFV